jgi:hypothetical protein
LRAGAEQAASDPVFRGIKNISDAGGTGVAFDDLYGSGKNPRMAVPHGTVPSLF